MTRGAKTAGYVIGALMTGGGGLLLAAREGVGLGLVLVGLVIVAGLALEPRYRRSGVWTATGTASWELTGERFVDDDTGEFVEVWYDPASGRREYRPVSR